MALTVVNNQHFRAIKFAPCRILSSPVRESVTGMGLTLDDMTIVIDNRAALVVELESVTGMVMTLDKFKKTRLTSTMLLSLSYICFELIVGTH